MRAPALLAVAAALVLSAPGSAAGQDTSSAPAAAFALRAGDVIEVFVWREEGLSGQFTVDERGYVSLPLVGSREVTSAPWTAVRDSLRAAYARELRDPDVRLTPKRRVFVLGFVGRPGPYLVDHTVPIAGAIALAGGASGEGDLARVRVMRDGEVLIKRASIDSPLTQADVRSGDQIFVDRRSWFDRNSTFIVSAMISVTSIVVTVILSQ